MKRQAVYAVKEDRSIVSVWFRSMTAAADALGLQVSHVCEVCSGVRRRTKGYVFWKAERR